MKRLKMLIYGDTGTGKTRLSLAFPKPFVIDMEGGSDWYVDEFDAKVQHATTPEEILPVLEKLNTSDHEFRTLVIDPITVYWEALQKKWSDIFLERNKGGKGYKHDYYDLQMRDWGTIKSELKDMFRRLTSLDMNVIIVAREKALYNQSMSVIGRTFDGPKGTDYWADVVVQAVREGDHYTAMVEKDRTNKLPREFPMDIEVFAKAYGDLLGMKSTPVAPARDEQLDTIVTLCTERDVSSDNFKRALAKYGVEDMHELSERQADDIIAKLEKKAS